MENGKNNRPQLAQLLKWAAVVTLTFFGAMWAYGEMKKRADAARPPVLNYTEFRQQVASGNVDSVTFHEESVNLEGVLKSAQGNKHFTVVLPPNNQTLLDELEKAGVVISAKKISRGGPVTWLIGILPWVVLISLGFVFMRQMSAGGQRAFSFGKALAKTHDATVPQTTFADVAGADEAKVELQEIIEFLKNPHKFTRLGGRLPKGALLVGSPGTGKTLLAKAVAGEAGRPFFSMSGSDFVEMFVGVGASRVRDLFEQGKKHAPCIIFIDELDAVGRHRGAGLGGGHDEREQTLNQLLVAMDGFEENAGVIILAATNRPDVLDPALLRPGRFDRQIVVDLPDARGREGVLRVHTRHVPLASDVRLEKVARGTPGLAGADLANIVNEAAVLAARKDKELVDADDFDEACDKVMLGVERRSLQLSQEELRLTAYHEAGHAIVGLKIPGSDPLHKVTIIPRGRALGLTHWIPEEDRHNYTKRFLEGRLAAAFGGRVAEELVFGPENVTTGATNDIEQATAIARRMVTKFGMSDKVGVIAVGDREQEIFLGREIQQRREISEKMSETVDAEIKRLVDTAYDLARSILTENRNLLDRLASALLERETLDGEEVRALERGESLQPKA